mmetsp:Transcript_20724/g.33538  ORF Transcript_20724/g.33538 Transcript_20724/m.33538 type:complete len:441 (+) Transcript_20724:67-1389(+)
MASHETTPLLSQPDEEVGRTRQLSAVSSAESEQSSARFAEANDLDSKLRHAISMSVLEDTVIMPDKTDAHLPKFWHKASKYTDGNFDEFAKSGLEPRGIVWIFGNMLVMVLKHYWFTILCSMLSAIACARLQLKNWNVIDPLIFKSLFVVIGFALGFRNVQASTRRTQAMSYIADLYSSSWGIIGIFADEDDDIRKKVKDELYLATDAIAHHMMMITHPAGFFFGIVGLQPASATYGSDEFRHFLADFDDVSVCSDVNFSPRTQVTQFFFLCEDFINRKEDGSHSQKMIRSFWAEKACFIASYNHLVHLAIPSVSQRYASLIDFSLFCFGVALSWGIQASFHQLEMLSGQFHVNPQMWLILNTLSGILMLLLLNALAVEHEDIIGSNVDDIHMHKMAILFKTAVEGYEHSRKELKSSGKVGLEREKAICSCSYSDGWNRL